MRIVEPRGHRALVERLWQAAAEGRLPHALAIEGPEGIGKYTAARWFASGLLCATGPGPPCGECGPCKRVRSGSEYGNHPDLFLIDAALEEEQQIRVHRIAYRPETPGISDPERCVEIFLDLRAAEGRGRAVLLREGHRMNASAQNALLKTLEEPRPGTYLLLETHRPELLLPTIHSRCVRVRFAPLTPEDCRAVLVGEGIEEERAAKLARWSGGSPGKALRLASRGAEAMRGLLEEVLAGRRNPLQAAAAVWEVAGDFPGKTALGSARNRAREFTDLALEVLADLGRRRAGLAPDELAHGDLTATDRLGEAAEITVRLEELMEIRADVERNLGPEVLVERALLVCGGQVPIL